MVDKKKTLADFTLQLGLTDNQVAFIKGYSKLRAASRFEKEALALVGKPELFEDWTYGGYIDTGKMGNGTCSRGHALRYEHYAINKISGEEVIFGIKCVTDFFQLSPMVLKLVQQGVMETNNEIFESLDKLEHYKTFDNYVAKTQIIERMEQVKDKLAKTKELQEAVHIGEMFNFLANKLPVPNWFEWRVNELYSKASAKIVALKDKHLKEILTKAKILSVDNGFHDNHQDIWEKVNSISEFFEDKGRISTAQVALLEKLVAVDYQEIDNIFAEIDLLPEGKYIKMPTFNEYNMISNFKSAYGKWGLSEKQIETLKKSYVRHEQHINEIKLQQLEA